MLHPIANLLILSMEVVEDLSLNVIGHNAQKALLHLANIV
jgi:hypothetical protein